MTKPRPSPAFPRHPFRSPKLTGAQAGWVKPAAAIFIALVVPAALAAAAVLMGGAVLSGPPKDGSGFSFGDHLNIVLAGLTASIVASWMIAPIALIGLRAAAMLGWAGWGTAILSALGFGLPIVHFALNGDVTTEDASILPHICIAITVLGLSVWAAYWALVAIFWPSEAN